MSILFFFFFSSRRRHTRWPRDWSSDVCSSDLPVAADVQGLLADLRDAAGDVVLDEAGIDAGTGHDLLEHGGQQIDGVGLGQGSVPLPNGTTDGLHDHGLAHGDAPS